MERPIGRGSLLRAAGTVGFFTLLSRVFGFVRDMVIANYFGTRAMADAFFVAFRIPNLLRRLTAEGALSAAFIPIFAKAVMEDRKAAFRLASNLLTVITLLLTLITIAGMIFAPLLLKVIAVGYTDDPEKFALTVYLTRVLFPYLIFVSLAAVFMGILNTMDHFAAPAASPILLNVSIILCAMFLHDFFSLPVYSLAAGVLLGGFLQLFIQVPFAAKVGFSYRPVFDLGSKLLRRIFALTLPAAVGIAVAEVNMFVDTMLASLLKEGSVSFLYYGNRLVQFPLGVFAIAMSTALLPRLSFQAGKSQPAEMAASLSKSTKAMFFLILPSTAGLIVLREPIISVLFERGEFDAYATGNTAYALACYALGLVAFSGVKIFVSAFYALGDTKTPVKIASYAMLINIVLNIILMGPFEHGGLALATSISSGVNLLWLIHVLRTRLGEIDRPGILKSFMLISIASSFMVFAVYAAWGIFFGPSGYTASGLVSSIMVAVFSYLAIAWLMKLDELTYFYNTVAARFRRR